MSSSNSNGHHSSSYEHDDISPLPLSSIDTEHVLPFRYSSSVPAVGYPMSSSSTPVPALFRPLKLRDLVLKNRLAVSPMCQYSSHDGFLSDFHLCHLGRFAMGGAALVIQEATGVSANGRISPHCPGIWKDEHMAMSKRVVQLVHSQGAAIGIQLAHAGRKASTPSPFLSHGGKLLRSEVADGGWPEDVVGASAIPWNDGWIVPRALTVAEIHALQDDFVKAALRSVESGYDMICLHFAHGYLASSFFSPLTNTRTDEYGGSFDNRVRFALEIARKVRAVIPVGMPMSARISVTEWVDDVNSWKIEDSVKLAPLLIAAGVDIIETSSGGNHPRQTISPLSNYQIELSEAVKKAHGSLVQTAPVGRIVTAQVANEIIAEGKGDLVLVGRQWLRDPNFAQTCALELGHKVFWGPQQQWAIGSKI